MKKIIQTLPNSFQGIYYVETLGTGSNTPLVSAIANHFCKAGDWLDAGTGKARIPVLLWQIRSAWQVKTIDFAQNRLRISAEDVTPNKCLTLMLMMWFFPIA